MKNPISFRAVVMNNAHSYFHATGEAWRTCMLKAWGLYRLRKNMKHGYVRFLYKKTNGTMREALGTLMDIPQSKTTRGTAKKPNYGTFCYFDGGKGEFRSFRIENLLTSF